MPAGNLVISAEDYVEGPWSRPGSRFEKPVVAQELAEFFYQEGDRISAAGVLTDAAAQFSEGRFQATALALLQKIIDAERTAYALRAVAETCLQHDHPKHLVAAVRLLGMAHEYDRADTYALELLVRAFDKMGLEEKARKVEQVLAEIQEEEPTLPIAVERPISRS